MLQGLAIAKFHGSRLEECGLEIPVLNELPMISIMSIKNLVEVRSKKLIIVFMNLW